MQDPKALIGAIAATPFAARATVDLEVGATKFEQNSKE